MGEVSYDSPDRLLCTNSSPPSPVLIIIRHHPWGDNALRAMGDQVASVCTFNLAEDVKPGDHHWYLLVPLGA